MNKKGVSAVVKAIKQHYVPQFYLKNFGKNLFCADKTKEKIFQTTPKKISYELNFYGPVINNEHLVEKRLSELEGKFSTAVKELIVKENVYELSAQNFKNLCGFVAIQYLRTAEVRRQIAELGDSLLHELLKRNFPHWTEKTIKRIKVSDALNLLTHLKIIAEYTSFANVMLHMKFITIKNKTPTPFWTSDNPIALENKFEQPPFSNLGICCKGIEFHLPINPNLGIIVCDPVTFEDRSNVLIMNNEDQIFQENLLQAHSSTRFLFSKTKKFHKLHEMLTKNIELKNTNRKRAVMKTMESQELNKVKLEIWCPPEIMRLLENRKKRGKTDENKKENRTKKGLKSEYLMWGFSKRKPDAKIQH